MKRNSKLLFWLVIVFGILNLLDIITASFIQPGETNPIFLLFGSIFALWIFKILYFALIVWLYFKNEYPSKKWLFTFIYILVMGSLALALGVFTNVVGMLNPEVVTSAASVSVAEKTSYYAQLVTVIMIIPYILAITTFSFYEKIINKVKIKKK